MEPGRLNVSSLESERQRLIAESELNRAQLSTEWQTMARGLHDLAHQVTTLGAWASSAALLAAGVPALGRGSRVPGAAKSSWLEKMLASARMASAIWLAFRARGHTEKPR
jgi:hypothetical protein